MMSKIFPKIFQQNQVVNKSLDEGSQAFLTVPEAARYLKVSHSTLYKHTSAGNIPFYKPSGKLLLFKKLELDIWIHKSRVPSNDELENI